MSEDDEIPEHGKAGVAFANVELKDGWPLIASIFVALPVGKIYGVWWYFLIPFATYHALKAYIEWKKNRLDDFWTVMLFKFGLTSLSAAFSDFKTIFVGDDVIITPGQQYDFTESNEEKDTLTHGTENPS
ncbi:hypothetical protein [Herbaspirillum sp.]|uniref:hypothetical protein n=1 Tax=Herbaspirillum sp. TaxID=1890675 RepID=UPI000C0AB4D1|nr:hypothetical protein [Herbaspirillum sp.]MAF04678.1 hypothetical protein [Herbaspirillum sp.]